MIALRLAAIIAAFVTIVLNAHHGYANAATLEYAVLFAVLNATLDVAKCALIAAGVRAWRSGAKLIACFAFLLFPLLFINSMWNAVSQVAISRDAGQATAVALAQARKRTEAAHKRLSDDLALMKAAPTFSATAACSRPRSASARSFCATVARTKSELDTADTKLAGISPADPAPQITLLAALTGQSVAVITFTLAIVPVLLAEMVGSFGFVIAAIRTPNATGASVGRFWSRWAGRRPRPTANHSQRAPSAVGAGLASSRQPDRAAAGTITWGTPAR